MNEDIISLKGVDDVMKVFGNLFPTIQLSDPLITHKMVVDRHRRVAPISVGIVEVLSEDVVVMSKDSIVVPDNNVLRAHQSVSTSQGHIVVLHQLLTHLP